MAFFNRSTNELTAKIVYYGPGLSGKTSNLEYIYENMDESERGRMLSLSTDSDRTILFDFMPLEMGKARGVNVRIQLYTVPGQVFYQETRKKVLKGTDGVVFVADSQKNAEKPNLDSMEQLKQHLTDNGLNPDDTPLVIQYNKRDLKDILPIEELDKGLNPGPIPFYEAIATEGVGVEDTLKGISSLVLRKIFSKPLEGLDSKGPEEEFFEKSSADEKVDPWGQTEEADDSLFDEAEATLLNPDETGSLKLDNSKENPLEDSSAESLFEESSEEELMSGEDLLAGDEFEDEAEGISSSEPSKDFVKSLEETDPGVQIDETPPVETRVEDYESGSPKMAIRVDAPIELVLEIDGKRYKLIVELRPED